MRIGRVAAAGALAVCLCFTKVSAEIPGENFHYSEQLVPGLIRPNEGDAGKHGLYALSAVLMDGKSGRVLYEKDGTLPRPNASTTKILTCVLALEHASEDEYVEVSARAAAQPDVQLGIQAGERYYLKDLLYSMMLKSHNDSAVAIAEHIGGSVEHFAFMMNEKAKAIGCTDTHFITPNGLDATDSGGVHHTTARDLALIMSYAIKNKDFLRITQTRDYMFSDLSQKRQFTLHNANAFLDMKEGVLSGKTGFTSSAGYCYVCACESEGRIFVVALLGCGWPDQKNYKWSDTNDLLSYGEENYQSVTYWKDPDIPMIPVQKGVTDTTQLGAMETVTGICQATEEEKQDSLLLRKDEKIICKVSMKDMLAAPVKKGDQIGSVMYYLGAEKLASYPVVADHTVNQISYYWCVDKVFYNFFHFNRIRQSAR